MAATRRAKALVKGCVDCFGDGIPLCVSLCCRLRMVEVLARFGGGGGGGEGRGGGSGPLYGPDTVWHSVSKQYLWHRSFERFELLGVNGESYQ